MFDEQQIATWFSVPEQSQVQKDAYAECVEATRELADTINRNMPDGEDKTQVISSLRQSILTVELAIRYRYKSPISIAKGFN